MTGHVIQLEARDNNTAMPLVGVLVTSSGRVNNIIIISIIGAHTRDSQTPVGYRRFQTGYVFTYLLNRIYLILRMYTWYKFLKTRTSDRTLIVLNQLLRLSGFSLYPPTFIFPLQPL